MREEPSLLSLLTRPVRFSCLVAWAGLACTSASGSGGGAPADGGDDDATAETSSGTGTEAGPEAGQETSTGSEPCDASIRLPTDGGTGTACGRCLEQQCASSLAMCQTDCLCVSSVECLAVNSDNYTLCQDALAAIGAGNPGLTAVAGCIAMSCVSACNATD